MLYQGRTGNSGAVETTIRTFLMTGQRNTDGTEYQHTQTHTHTHTRTTISHRLGISQTMDERDTSKTKMEVHYQRTVNVFWGLGGVGVLEEE